MIKKTLIQYVQLFLLALISFNCTKQKSYTPEDSAPAYTSNPPTVSAGIDQMFFLPKDSCVLSGTVKSENAIFRYRWELISGPPGSLIEFPEALETKVKYLRTGIYTFSFIAVDKEGKWGTDTVSVIAQPPITPAKQILLQNVAWQCWWGCWIEIPDIHNHLPLRSYFNVYIKRDTSLAWEVVMPYSAYPNDAILYFYALDNGYLFIINNTSQDPTDTPDIKIEYWD